MGQRDGFASSDLLKLNKMYNCDSVSSFTSQGIFKPTFQRPTFQKPNRPSVAGPSVSGPLNPIVRPPSRPNVGSSNGGFTNPFAQFVSGIGNIFSALGGGKHDEADNYITANDYEED